MRLVFAILCSLTRYFLAWRNSRYTRNLVAELISLKAQLIVMRRKIPRSPQLSPFQRLTLAVCAALMSHRKLLRSSIVVKPSTLRKFHRWVVNRKYQRLFSSSTGKPGRPPISVELRKLILQIKSRNPSFGCPQIASLILDRTGQAIDDETIRRVLLKYYRGTPGSGPSWLTFIASQADSLWSVDLFCAESLFLKTHWIMVVMDQWSRKIVGFGVCAGSVNGECLCSMFNSIATNLSPRHLSHDHDPLFRFKQWTRNMAILTIDEIWTVPFVPQSHPFVERLIGTLRRELLDRIVFYGKQDLLRKLKQYQDYFNDARVHSGLDGQVPGHRYCSLRKTTLPPSNLAWKKYCNGFFHVPIAA